MQTTRNNQDWLRTLSRQDQRQGEVIEELRSLLLRASLYTLVTHLEELQELDERERMAIAEDCAQEALEAILIHLGDFRGESKFTTWAYKFSVNITLARARRERWKNVSLEQISEDDAGLDWLQWKENLQTTSSELPALRAEVGNVIENVIRDELTGRQRQVLKWIAFDEIPMDVVVERLAINRNAIYKLLHDARLKIKRRLMMHGYDMDAVYDLFQRMQ